MVTIDNYEEYLMMAADGELDAAGGAQLKAFLLQHPELAAEAESWTSLKLQPDVAVVYEAKDALLRQKPKSIALGWRVSLAAAASVALALVLLIRNRQHEVPQLAHNWSENAAVPVVKVVPDTPSHTASAATTVRPRHIASVKQERVKQQGSPSVRVQDELVALNAAAVSIPVANSQQPTIHPRQEAVSVNPIPALNNVPEQTEGSKRPTIHLATANVPALELIKEGVDARVSQISNTVKAIRETSFAVRIGNKSHYLNF